MLRAHLKDAALAAAKAWSHSRVEPRHVGYAIARHFRDRPEVSEVLTRAKRALEPRGVAHGVPELTSEAVALLDSIGSRDDALAVLERMFGDGAPTVDRDTREVGEATATEVDEAPQPSSSSGMAPAETVTAVLAELDRLVGLGAVKRQVRSVIAVVQANQERAKAGLATVNPGLHLVFTGPSGTGKTTVARLIARLYAAAGALPGSKFSEVDRSDLVAGYVGQTAIKTTEVVGRTLPGVLFVDEAYSLTPTHPSDFGAEAIATLVKAMEDHRHELAVIVAGYSQEMADFLGSNPGLSSRFKTFIDFPAYSPGELAEIFARFVDSTGLRLPAEALEKAENIFERAVHRADFGNARFARSLFEQAYARMALRAAADGDVQTNELLELLPDDVTWNELGVDARKDRIGFREHWPREGENEGP